MSDQPKNIDRLINTEATEQSENFELSLRPKRLSEFIGQPQVQKNLSTFISAASSRKEAMDHALLFGPPGLGKTTLAQIISFQSMCRKATLYQQCFPHANKIIQPHHLKA